METMRFFMHTGVQRNDVTNVTDARRASRGRLNLPYSIAQGHVRKYAASRLRLA